MPRYQKQISSCIPNSFRVAEGGWNVYVHTGDEKGAGTDANVFMVVYGKNKNGESIKSDEIKLENKGDTFERGQVDKFSVDIIDIGRPYKIRIGQDGSKAFAAWFLDKVTWFTNMCS